MRTNALLLSLTLLLVSGCASGPDYAGGPGPEDPAGIVSPGDDITLWAVDGYATASRAFSIRVAPGHRKLKVRIEHPIESDSWKPYEYKTLTLNIKPGVTYTLTRKESELPPYEVEVHESGQRRRARDAGD